MRCDPFHATIPVKQCLANQVKRFGICFRPDHQAGYPQCKKCETGKAAREGRLDDDDIEQLKATVQHSTSTRKDHPMGETAAQLEQATENTETGQATKICKKCPENGPQPIEHFSKHPDTKDGRENVCRKCRSKAVKARLALKKLRAEEDLSGKADAAKSRGKGSTGRRVSGVEPKLEQETHGTAIDAGPYEPCSAEPEALRLTITVDLSATPDLYQAIVRVADDEDRTPELQLRHWIKKHLQQTA